MAQEQEWPSQPAQEEQGLASSPALGPQLWQEPKLTFIEPTLTKHGTLQDVTGMAFFGGFSPVGPP